MSRILIIDHEPAVHTMLQRILEARGYSILSANDAAEGCALAAEQKPDLIIAGLDLPGLNGWAAIRQLKQDDRTAHIPVLALSGGRLSSDSPTVGMLPFAGFVAKPLRPLALLTTITTVLALASRAG